MSGSIRITNDTIMIRNHSEGTVVKSNSSGLFIVDPAHDTITTGIHTNGFTGIGTAEPQAVLHTIPTGSITAGDLTQGGLLIGDIDAEFAMGIDQNEIYQTGNDLYIGTLYNHDDLYGKIRFRTDDGGGLSDKMVISRNGDIQIIGNLTVDGELTSGGGGGNQNGNYEHPDNITLIDVTATNVSVSNDITADNTIRSNHNIMVYNGSNQDAINYTFGNHHNNIYFRVQYLSGNDSDVHMVGKIGMDYDNNAGTQIDNCYIKFYKDTSLTYGGYLTFSTYQDNERMRIDASGNVGIGTTNPGYKLEVEGSSRVDGKFVNGNDYQGNAAYGATFDSGSRYYQYRTADERYLTIYTSGNQQTTTIQAASNGAANNRLSINPSGGTVGINKGALLDPNATVSLDVNGIINYNGSINDVSDRRIKTNIHDLNDEEALERIRNLQPKKYNYIDTEQKTSDTVYGFIAQEVKDVIPFSVSTKRDAIPSIMNTYGCSTTVSEDEETITISIPNTIENITVGDTLMVKIDTNEYNTYSFNVDVASISESSVSVVVNASTIHTDVVEQVQHLNEVFIYGKFVDDFHILNKNAVFVVATAAIQELDRKVSNLTSENAVLKTQLSDLETRVATLEG